jgi:hypothetical protein
MLESEKEAQPSGGCRDVQRCERNRIEDKRAKVLRPPQQSRAQKAQRRQTESQRGNDKEADRLEYISEQRITDALRQREDEEKTQADCSGWHLPHSVQSAEVSQAAPSWRPDFCS